METQGQTVIFRFEEKPSDGTMGVTTGEYGLSFASMDDLFSSLTAEQPTERVCVKVRQFAKNAGVRTYPVLRLDRLYDPILPVSATTSPDVYWGGNDRIERSFRYGEAFGMVIFSESEYRAKLETDYINAFPSDSADQRSFTDGEGKNCVEIRSCKQADGKTVFAVERWTDVPENAAPQAGKLKQLELFVTHGNVSFTVRITDLAAAPDDAWILSFGAKPYEK